MHREVSMLRSLRTVLLLILGIASIIGCGARERPDAAGQGQSGGPMLPRVPPTPLPTRSVTGTGFDESRVPGNFSISYSGPYWVQLSDPAAAASIVVGVDPTRCGHELAQALADYHAEMDAPPLSEIEDSGSLETAALGSVLWARGRYREDTRWVEQIALFAHHPADRCLVIARSEFPGDRGSPEAKLEELVRLAELIGPGI